VKNLVLRADAGLEMGTGHVMRCLALAQAWQARGGRTLLVGDCSSERLRERVCALGVQLLHLRAVHPDPKDLQLTLEVLERSASEEGVPSGRIVVDGYHFGPKYQRALRERGHVVLVVDDLAHQSRYHADLLLNQNIYAPEIDYRCDADTTRLLGTGYALLRPEFQAWRSEQREHPEVARRFLVTMGGGDVDNVTADVLRAIARLDIDGLRVCVTVGSHNPNRDELQAELRSLGLASSVRLLVDPPDLPRWMAWADVAVSAAGTTSWELAFLGVPTVLGVVAENQVRIADGVAAAGAARTVGWFRDAGPDGIATALDDVARDPELRNSFSQAGRALVDGHGSARVVRALQSCTGAFSAFL